MRNETTVFTGWKADDKIKNVPANILCGRIDKAMRKTNAPNGVVNLLGTTPALALMYLEVGTG